MQRVCVNEGAVEIDAQRQRPLVGLCRAPACAATGLKLHKAPPGIYA